MTTQTNALAPLDFSPIIPVPDEAPKPKVDFSNPHLSFEDVLPKTFLSMEALQAWLDTHRAESRIVTITSVTMEYLWNAEKKNPDQGEWKPVLWFAEMEQGLPVNQTRGLQLTKMAGSSFLAAWAKLGQVAIRPGIVAGNAQIVIMPVPAAAFNGGHGRATTIDQDYTAANANDDLFS